jgi:hypothetical protein
MGPHRTASRALFVKPAAESRKSRARTTSCRIRSAIPAAGSPTRTSDRRSDRRTVTDVRRSLAGQARLLSGVAPARPGGRVDPDRDPRRAGEPAAPGGERRPAAAARADGGAGRELAGLRVAGARGVRGLRRPGSGVRVAGVRRLRVPSPRAVLVLCAGGEHDVGHGRHEIDDRRRDPDLRETPAV